MEKGIWHIFWLQQSQNKQVDKRDYLTEKLAADARWGFISLIVWKELGENLIFQFEKLRKYKRNDYLGIRMGQGLQSTSKNLKKGKINTKRSDLAFRKEKRQMGQCVMVSNLSTTTSRRNQLSFSMKINQHKFRDSNINNKSHKTYDHNNNSMNTIQQVQATRPDSQEKDEVTTQAETFFGGESPSMTERILENLPVLKKQILRNHDISARISQGTFSSDKILRLLSAILKVFRNYNILKNLKSFERLSAQIGQLRRFLRYDRVLMVIKEHIGYFKKGRMTKIEKIMVLFKMMIIFGDFNDILAFFMQLKVISNDNLLPKLRKNVANIYFLECLGWLIYHLYEYNRSTDDQGKQKNKMLIIKYFMDTLTSHNDFSSRLFTIEPQLASVIGAFSSFFNLYLIWK